MMGDLVVDQEVRNEMGTEAAPQPVCDEVPTFWVSKNVCGDAFQLLSLIPPRSVEFEAGRQNGRYNSTKSPRAIPSDAAKYHGQGPRKSRSDGFSGLARRDREVV